MSDRSRDPYAELRRILSRSRIDENVAAELEHHFDALVARNLEAGMSEDEARRAALQRFGDMDRIREETRRVDRHLERREATSEHLADAARGVRYAIRRLLRRPEFTLFAVLTLTLAIGAFSALFTVLDRVVLSPLAYTDAGELVWIESAVPSMGEDAVWGLSQAGYFDFRDNGEVLESVAAYSAGGANFVSEAGPARVRYAAVTATLGEVLDLRTALGRWFDPEEDRPGAPQTVVLGYGFWRDRFGADPGVLGSTIELNDVAYEVIGVLERGLGLPRGPVDVLRTLSLDPSDRPVNAHWLSAVGRLGGPPLAAAQADLDRLTSTFTDKFPNAYPTSFMEGSGFRTRVVPLKQHVLGDIGRTVWILFGAAGLLLVIAVANVTNLYLVRIETRRRDFAVRAALGAGRRHLVWQSVSETLVLSLFAGALALAIARGGIGLLAASAPAGLPRLEEIGLATPTLWFTLGVSLVLGVFLGLIPLAYGAFDRATDLAHETGSRTTPSRGRNRVRRLMLAGQMALALVLLAAGGLMLRSLDRMRSTELGFDASDVLELEIFLPWSRYGSYEEVGAFYRRFTSELEGLPGVVRAGATTRLPLIDGGPCATTYIEDRPPESGEEPPCIPYALAAPGFFETLDIPVDGATSGWTEMESGAGGVVVTRALADRLWPGESAIGKGIKGNGWSHPFYRVIGVADDFRSDGLDRPPFEAVFYPMYPMEGAPLWSPPNAMRVVVESTADPAALVPAVRRILGDLDPGIPIAEIDVLEAAIAGSPAVSRVSFTLLLLGIAAAMALLLSTIGMYGIVAQLVVERSREIAVRLALGARLEQVIRMFLAQSLGVAIVGAIAGLAGALVATRALRALLFEVAPGDPLTLAAATALLLTTVAAATYLASRKAGRVDPIETLKAE